jgi:hypothetical protein
MRSRPFIAAALAAAFTAFAAAAFGAAAFGAAETAIPPFSAHYDAQWHTITVGTSDLELGADGAPDRYVYNWKITARGIFRLLYANPITQKSWFTVHGGQVVPTRYRADDGATSVALDFDWGAGRARGTSGRRPVDLQIKDGTQDLMSIQVEIMQDLRSGAVPPTFQIVDKDEVKDFDYADEGTARIHTALGVLDTRVVSSRRPGSNRVLRMWFAPSLDFVPVQAERWRAGTLEFAMRIKNLSR